jgi:Flp pilus assembly protein TadD
MPSLLSRPPLWRSALLRRSLSLVVLGLLVSACDTIGALKHPTPGLSRSSEIGLDSSLRLAGAALSGGDIDSALRLYRAAVLDHPGALEAHRGLANAYYSVKAYPEAEAAYRRLATLQPTAAEPVLGLGRVALAAGDHAAATQHFQAALTLAPGDAQAQNGLAVAHDFAGDHEAAQTLYAAILTRNPTNRAVANNLALSKALSGALPQAIEALTDLSDGPTIMPEARYNLALAYAMQGDEVAARRLIQRDLSQEAMQDTLAFYRTLSPQTASR